MKKRVTCVIFGIFMAVSFSSVCQSADVIRLKFNNFFAATHFASLLAGQFLQRCQEAHQREG